MASVLVDLIPSAIGLALTPAAIAAGILLLSSARPVANATALAFALVYAGISATVLAVAASSSGPLLSERTKSLIEIGVGGLLIALAAGTMLRGRAGQHKPSRIGQYESVSSSSSAWRSSPKESPASRGFEASEPADARSSPEARDGPQSRHRIVARQANART